MELQLSLQSVELFAGVDNWLATPTPQKDLTVLGAWTKPSNTYNYIHKIIGGTTNHNRSSL